jgi:thiol-disulfide isomerase/thioredoxin
MRWLLSSLLSVVVAGSGFCSAVGDTYDQVISEKGRPASRIDAGAMQILSYPDQVIKLKNGVVVSVREPDQAPPPGSPPVAPRPTPVPTNAPEVASQPEAPASAETWTTDYDAALERAKNENKKVFLFFTGSDWCGWCRKLNREILTTPEFTQYAQDKLILVELDFPRHKEQPSEVKVQNRMLEGRYNITGYPTVVVLNSAGTAVARMGYQQGGPGPFIARIQALGD